MPVATTHHGPILGAIADDFTGATDLAGMLVKQGLRTLQSIGIPDAAYEASFLQGLDAVVIALKTRTVPASEAVEESLQALAWCQRQGCSRFVSKICSTFDSTASGNIGPVADALMAALGTDLSVVCPAFPANGRTVYQGHLFVGDTLLEQTGMRDHPLTPMRDSNLVRVLQAQSRARVGLLAWPTVAAGPQAVREARVRLRAQGVRLVIADALQDADLVSLGLGAEPWPLAVAGSGLALGLAAQVRAVRPAGAGVPENEGPGAATGNANLALADWPRVQGAAAILAGSCSSATQAQVAHLRALRPAWRLDPVVALADPEAAVQAALAWALPQLGDQPILVYSTAEPSAVRAIQSEHGAQAAGTAIEQVLARIARALVDAGVRRLIVAGGETSGAVVKALGVRWLRIGPEIAPGVPWTVALPVNGAVGGGLREPLALALKSGNFGGPDFFVEAWGHLP